MEIVVRFTGCELYFVISFIYVCIYIYIYIFTLAAMLATFTIEAPLSLCVTISLPAAFVIRNTDCDEEIGGIYNY